jgi:4-amino-4-deoxychorismate lyase
MVIINDKIENGDIINLDNGFIFGKGLFETIYIRHKPVLLNEHLNRLNSGLKKIGIEKNISKNYFMNTIEMRGCKNCAVKLMVSDKNVIFVEREIPYKENDYKKGFSIIISEMKRNPYSHMTYLKSFNYYDNILERKKAKDKGYDEALFLNTEDCVSEGSISNIFYIKNNIIYTPSVSCGLLEGVVRNFLIHNIKKYKICETKFNLDNLLSADGVFLTNSLMGVMKVSSINDIPIQTCECFNNIKKTYNEFLSKY